MEKTEINIRFSKVKASYLEVKEFLEKETGDRVTSLDMDIEEGLRIGGDDTYELIEKFVSKYNLRTSGFDISRHFLSEGEQFNSGIALTQILTLPITLLLFLIKFITLGHINLTNKVIAPEYGRKTIGMTFGDLITWHILGTYQLRHEVQIILKSSA